MAEEEAQLGLATTRELIQEVNARLHVSKVIGEGTVFDLEVEVFLKRALREMRPATLDYRTVYS